MDSCRRLLLRTLSLLPLAPGLVLAGANAPARIDEDEIQVRRQGETWTVEAQFVVPVPPSQPNRPPWTRCHSSIVLGRAP